MALNGRQNGTAQAVVAPRSAGVTIMELREAMCRFPLGDPTSPEFRFCGARAITGLPYCSHHARIAYQPAAERKRLRT
jgi:GcrA cell cycle regulator